MLLMSPLSVVKVGPNQIDVKIVELQRCKLQIGERHASAELTGRSKGFHRCCMVLSLTHPPHQHAKDQRSNAMNHRKICQTTIPGLTRRLGLAGNHVIICVYIYIHMRILSKGYLIVMRHVLSPAWPSEAGERARGRSPWWVWRRLCHGDLQLRWWLENKVGGRSAVGWQAAATLII